MEPRSNDGSACWLWTIEELVHALGLSKEETLFPSCEHVECLECEHYIAPVYKSPFK